MADIQSQISDARKAGYDDAAIATHISGMPEYRDKMNTALTAGYKPAEILGFLSTPRATSLVDQIPGMPPVAAPSSDIPQRRKFSVSSINPAMGAYGLAEAGTQMLTGLGASALGGLRGLGSLAIGEGPEIAARKLQATQEALTYQPRSDAGATAARIAGMPLELASEGAGYLGAKVGGVLGNEAAGRTIGEAAPAVVATVAGAPSMLRGGRAVSRAMTVERDAEQLAQSRARAPQIDAAKKADELGIALNPALSNPTVANKVKGVLIGNRDVNAAITKANDNRITEIAKRDLGVTTKLDAKTYEQIRKNISGPYDQIRGLPTLVDDGTVAEQINRLRSDPLIGGRKTQAKVNSLIDDALETVTNGADGRAVLNNIEQLRKDANNIFNSLEKPDRKQRALADTSIGIANALESLVDANLASNPSLLADFRAARVKNAQSYVYEKATDFNTGRVDPLAIAKLTSKDNALTGRLADIGEIAGNFPEAFASHQNAPAWQRHLTRSGPAGTAGFAVGSLFGAPFTGGIIGAALGELGGALGSKRIASEGYQSRHAVPTDYRPIREAMGYNQLANAAQPTSNLPVPYVSRGPVVQPGNYPNWVPGRATVDPNIQPSMPQGPAQLPAPSAEATMRNVGQQRAYELARDRAAAAQAEQTAAGQEAAGRQPTGRGTLYDLDPVTGRLKPVSEGMKGATPDVIASTGFPLSAAVEKVSSGRSFALSAEERLAWNKAKVDLATVEPDFNTLSDKAILGKMQDRQWVAAAVTKAREKAAAFDQRAQRTDDPQKMRAAAKSRDEMLDIAESLEQRLRGARPVAKSTQGPKTREAIRNALRVTPEDNINNLGK